jgi:hypothetical protein
MWTSNDDSLVFTCGPAPLGRASWTGRHRQPAGSRLFGDRARRRLVKSLRKLANRRPARDGTCRRFEVLVHERVAPVRGDLLEIAALLEHERHPDPGCLVALHRLLTDGCASPLYNHDVQPSELSATLYYVRMRLAAASFTADPSGNRYGAVERGL